MALSKIGFAEGTDKYIPTHSFTENSQTVDMERVAPGAGVLGAWDDSAPDVSATGLVSSFSVTATGRGRISVGAKCETTADYFYTAYLVFKNSSGTVVGLSATFQGVFKQLDDGGTPAKKYASIQTFANDCGASTVELYLVALPAGASSIDLYMAAI